MCRTAVRSLRKDGAHPARSKIERGQKSGGQGRKGNRSSFGRFANISRSDDGVVNAEGVRRRPAACAVSLPFWQLLPSTGPRAHCAGGALRRSPCFCLRATVHLPCHDFVCHEFDDVSLEE